ncbi:uncharacterized protein LOC129247842 [Anastrepha obliqua]|uniref:uncharacterized protein LOC129247842 n=1 Tax=Anastrepha obliqua TaxID=95512 RepID=UPI00240A4EF1|nr:uncharacterized protein LOC129247842 [Anastrepha obliqua]XP_054743161.1 uncharacterized protein LOC129247842 [Anastrepha obliqua]
MGNVCSSGDKRKNDSISEKSDDSSPYQEANKKEIQLESVGNNSEKLAPLADPEPVPPDVPFTASAQNEAQQTPNEANKDAIKGSQCLEKDSETTTPLGLNAPSDIPNQKSAPNNLAILQGKPPPGRKIERDKKIVIYILANNSPEYKKHKRVIHSIFKQFVSKCQSKGFDFLISDVHENDVGVKKDFSKLPEVKRWTQSPQEAQGGHEEAANCLSEISRHTSTAYIIPVLFLGSTLGTPMLPLTIESQDFTSVLGVANEEEKVLLEKWYTIDNSYQPMCHRLYTQQINIYSTEVNGELNHLLEVLLRLFSDDLKDSYLTTVVEQEINNTVLISQELAKRCIWIQTGAQYTKLPENASQLDAEVLRRITKVYAELKMHLSEKNLIRILPTMNILDEELTAVIENLLDKSITSIFEEHQNKNSIPYNTNGVDKVLLEEVYLISHYSKILAQNSANFDIMNDVKRYLKDNTQWPLVISGASGCGKSVLASKIMENVQRWKPDATLILRYVNLTVRSSDLTSLLGSITDQLSILANGCQCNCDHSIEGYSNILKELLENQDFFVVIIIDSLDEILFEANLDWLPVNLNSTSKVILTVTDTDNKEESPILKNLSDLGIPNKCFIKMKQFTERQWNDILSSGGSEFYASNGALKLPEEWKTLRGKTPLHAKSLWWLAWLSHMSISITDISDVLDKMLQILETKLQTEHVEMMLLIVAVSDWGIRESDCLGIFQKQAKLEAQAAFKIWSKFCWLMGPMLLVLKNIRIADKSFRDAVFKRYTYKRWLVHKSIRDYFDRQESILPTAHGNGHITNYNYQKYLKLPYHHFCAIIEDNAASDKIEILFNCFYFTDLQWIADKVHSNGPAYLMHDLLTSERLAKIEKQSWIHISFLKDFLKNYMRELSYDGHQFFTLINYYMKARIRDDITLKDDEKIRSWLEYTYEIEIPFMEILNSNLGSDEGASTSSYDVLVNLPQKGYYVASISTEREEICIWAVENCSRVRQLLGIPQPTSMCPVGNYEAAVLCRREIRVINLDEGKYKKTLKGVMNQKMPYFGLHDQNHIVCLSRNRMYVHLMNLESGDCVMTFKAGEDRFLNSLLVSGDGRILVCGDETQKPFPLLVWHLSQKKLLYDLRIPHHDFITSLSAITYEGSYVCVVAKELNEPTPNFIVVYDLQSGTLFKKWKPVCNTVSLAISQANACVIAGLEDAKILIWDLITGNCRSTLIGHNAPVTFLKLDPLGKVLLSRDKEGCDNSIRVWELNTGKSLAVYKPPGQITACEILPNGAFVVVALKNRTELLTLALKNYGEAPLYNCYLYGNQDNQNQTFNLN